MIKTFKIFEDWKDRDIKNKLAEQFDEDFVDEYWEEHFMRDAKDIIETWPRTIWKFIDDDKYITDLIDEEKGQMGIRDFGEYDYREYLKNNMDDKKEKKVRRLFNKKIKDKENKATYYEDDMLDDLNEKQLRKIIEDFDEEEEFVEYTVTNRYEGRSAKDIASEYTSLDNGKELYKMFQYYIEDDEVEKDYLEDMTYNNKIEDIKEEIYRTPELQQKLLDIKKSNALLLGELYKEEKDEDNIYSTYEFQKLYLKYYFKKHNNDPDLMAEELKFLNDNFGLDSILADKYSDYMWLVNRDKFNL